MLQPLRTTADIEVDAHENGADKPMSLRGDAVAYASRVVERARQTNGKRFRVWYAVLAAVCGAAWGGVVTAHVLGVRSALDIPLTVRVTVAPGDSLWSLSDRYGDPAAGRLERIDALARANGLRPNTRLVAGEKLLVPVTNPVELARRQCNVAAVR
jgi:hypothetical protein